MPGPQSLIAEVTHRCPLHCVYCSNPLEMESRQAELSTELWSRVFREAAGLGVLHLHLTGGEPLARHDLTELVSAGHSAGLYLNLITSGLGLTPERIDELVRAGLDHLQLSLQDSEAGSADEIAGTRAHARKIALAGLIRRYPLAFTLNVVVHRRNLDRLPDILALAEELRVDRLEIANVQYYGWALRNRDQLMPTREQLERSLVAIGEAQERLAGRMRIEFVAPDYYARYPKACMGGWGRNVVLVNPRGEALPCHAAKIIPGLSFANVADRPLRWIWEESPAFNRFRGEEWMQEPCRSCDRRHLDFGGCRCQALLLAGDAAATDPACSLAPGRVLVDAALARAQGPAEWVYRIDPM
jgi:pyrroloquinoline quinone biosynthesis protein E